MTPRLWVSWLFRLVLVFVVPLYLVGFHKYLQGTLTIGQAVRQFEQDGLLMIAVVLGSFAAAWLVQPLFRRLALAIVKRYGASGSYDLLVQKMNERKN